jgi:hypothetical protein
LESGLLGTMHCCTGMVDFSFQFQGLEIELPAVITDSPL